MTNDRENNFQMIKSSVDSGSHGNQARACLYVGLCYLHGLGVEESTNQAIAYLKRSLTSSDSGRSGGNTEARKLLALIHTSSTSTKSETGESETEGHQQQRESRQESFNLFTALAEQDDYLPAQLYLAQVYETGDAELQVTRDLQMSQHYLLQAAHSHHHLPSIHRLIEMFYTGHLSHSQLASRDETEDEDEMREALMKLLNVGIRECGDVKCAATKLDLLLNGHHTRHFSVQPTVNKSVEQLLVGSGLSGGEEEEEEEEEAENEDEEEAKALLQMLKRFKDSEAPRENSSGFGF